jgi:arylsulfatase A-like enzyme
VNSAPLFHGFATLWEGGIRIPLIMRLPGRIAANTVSATSGIAMDITATILDVAGINYGTGHFDGASLMPGLAGEPGSASRPLFWRADLYDFGAQRAVRDGRYKYMEHGNTQFLFDLTTDPGERDNLFSQRLDEVNRLRQMLGEWEQGLLPD